MFSFARYTNRQFDSDETFIMDGGDLFHLVSSTVPLTIKFYGENNQVIGRLIGVTQIKLNFFDGLLMKQSLDEKRAVGNNLPELPRAFAKVGITAASPVTPDIIITGGGIDSDSFVFSGSFSMVAAGSVLGAPALAMVDTDTAVIPANASRKGVWVSNAAQTGTGAIWVSDTAGLSDGIPVFPGSAVFFPVTGALEIYSDQANILGLLEVMA